MHWMIARNKESSSSLPLPVQALLKIQDAYVRKIPPQRQFTAGRVASDLQTDGAVRPNAVSTCLEKAEEVKEYRLVV